MPRPPTRPDLDSMKPDDVKALVVDLLEEIGRLRDEIARLKGLPPRPPFKPSRMEDGTDNVTSQKLLAERPLPTAGFWAGPGSME